MNKIVKVLCSIPKTLFINFRHLPLYQACKLPIVVTYNTKTRISGKILLGGAAKIGMIRVGFHQSSACNTNDQTLIIVGKNSILRFNGTAHMGNGTKLHVYDNASLILGDNFAISASSVIKTYKSIEFGRDIQFSWNCLVMDSDTHIICNKDGQRINDDKPIVFGDRIWIGCNSTILKGSIVPSCCVIGANSVVSGHEYQNNTIIAGNPAKCIKEIGSWKI